MNFRPEGVMEGDREEVPAQPILVHANCLSILRIR